MQEEVQKESEEICKGNRLILYMGLVSSSFAVSASTISGLPIGLVASFLFVSFVGQVVLCVDFCDGGFF